jgi:hypothetical protein
MARDARVPAAPILPSPQSTDSSARQSVAAVPRELNRRTLAAARRSALPGPNGRSILASLGLTRRLGRGKARRMTLDRRIISGWMVILLPVEDHVYRGAQLSCPARGC